MSILSKAISAIFRQKQGFNKLENAYSEKKEELSEALIEQDPDLYYKLLEINPDKVDMDVTELMDTELVSDSEQDSTDNNSSGDSEAGEIMAQLSRRSKAMQDGIDLNELDFNFQGNVNKITRQADSTLQHINPLTVFSYLADMDFESLHRQGYITPQHANSPLAKSFRDVRQQLLDNTLDEQGKPLEKSNLIMITSAKHGEGKSYSATNLAISIALEKDRHVLLIDADISNPSLHNLAGTEMGEGLLDLLEGKEVDMSRILYKTNIPTLSMMFSGHQDQQSCSLLGSQAMKEFVNEISSRYQDRVVIFDSPALSSANEINIMASFMGQIVMVVEAEKTSLRDINKELDKLSNESVFMLLNRTNSAKNTLN